MTIMYLTWGETPRSYGVFGSQVVGKFLETSKIMPNDNFYFVSAIPLIHSGMVREKWKYYKEIQKIKDRLGKIKFIRLPIYASQNFINSTKLTFNFMHSLAHLHLKNLINRIKPNIIHCRSYHSAWAALKVREKYKFNYKIVFDGRGLWPEEIALKKSYTEDDKNYLFLKSIEKELLEKCDISISVSDTMYEYYKKLGNKKGKCIYLSSSIEKLAPKEIEKNTNGTINFCYVGALSENTWHKPTQLSQLIKHLKAIVKNIHLTIVTTSNHEDIKKYFQDMLIEELTFTSTKSIGELKKVLAETDIGILSYKLTDTNIEKIVGNSVLAIKTVEYLASGLPVIVNENCGGAAFIIKSNNLGISYNPKTFESLTKESINNLLDIKLKKRCIEFSKKNFDYKINALKYKNVYESFKL